MNLHDIIYHSPSIFKCNKVIILDNNYNKIQSSNKDLCIFRDDFFIQMQSINTDINYYTKTNEFPNAKTGYDKSSLFNCSDLNIVDIRNNKIKYKDEDLCTYYCLFNRFAKASIFSYWCSKNVVTLKKNERKNKENKNEYIFDSNLNTYIQVLKKEHD